MPVSGVKTAVENANEILFQFLKTAAMVLHEPSFYHGDWVHVKDLLPKVARKRFDRVVDFQAQYGLSDDEISDAFLDPTLELLIRAEEFGLKTGHERLQLNTVGGPLQ